ncbi:MAG: endopeptidase La [Sulfobacillus sp.]|nr:endopeptidase La [Sulfobacillus sp.]
MNTRELPLLPLRGVLVFPLMVVPLEIGREKSLRALEEAMAADRLIVFVAQKDTRQDEPGEDDLYRVGVTAEIKQVLKMPTGGSKVVVEGKARAKVQAIYDRDTHFAALVEEIEEPSEDVGQETEALMHTVVELFEAYVKNSRKMPGEASVTLNIDDPGRLADTVVMNLDIRTQEKQEVLETFPIDERLSKVSDILSRQIELLEIEKRIHVRVRKQMERSQKEYYLREQLKAIQRELGEQDEAPETEEYRERLERLGEVPEPVREKITREIDRLAKMSPLSAEAVVVRTYLDWLLDLPWAITTEERVDVEEAERILNEDHYGLQKVKDRILEHLSVLALAPQIKGPILCLVGPPGVGKTSLARSIARATGRRFVRVSLGGVRDEAEIRGHRRTYVGAMPGRIIQGMRQAGSKNPLFLLDEVDKMATDFRGDPSAAFLEVLDPEQNAHFSDHYIELPFDLSAVMFIATANVLHSIPRPLMDRMEVIHIPGYTEEEKISIAERYLWPRQLEQHGLSHDRVALGRRVLQLVIRHYTREAGVRELERSLATICRKAAREIVQGKTQKVVVTSQRLVRYLGAPRIRLESAEMTQQTGVVTGLAVTEAGGDILSIEVTTMPGKGQLTLTGQLGEVMQESARAGYSYVRSRARELGIDPHFNEALDVHVHVPAGAIPKDGPSAGIAIATALVSALSGRAVRPKWAMTGEITLRGRVLPVGGIKEKILAAHRAHMEHVIIPEENRVDLDDVPPFVKRQVKIHLAQHLDDVLEWVLEPFSEEEPSGR